MQQKEKERNQDWCRIQVIWISGLSCILQCLENWEKKYCRNRSYAGMFLLLLHLFYHQSQSQKTINLSMQSWSLRGCVNGTIKNALKADTWQSVKISPFLKLNGMASPRMGDEGIERLLHYFCNSKPDGFKSQMLHTWVSHCSKWMALGSAKWNLGCPWHWDMFHSTSTCEENAYQLIERCTSRKIMGWQRPKAACSEKA